MQIDTAGTYTLKYTAEDECGNVTEVTREVVAEQISYRTVLYTDGTFIINESSRDRAANEALHGAATNVYAPFDPNGSTDVEKYIFNSAGTRPWYSERSSILSVEVGEPIQPTSLSYWFQGCSNATSIDLHNVDASLVTSMGFAFSSCESLLALDLSHFVAPLNASLKSTFANCKSLTQLDVSNLDTSNVTNMSSAFYECSAMEYILIPNFVTSSVTFINDMFGQCYSVKVIDISGASSASLPNNKSRYAQMFRTCRSLQTIYASANFDLSAKPTDLYFFTDDDALIGGAGTAAATNSTDSRYACIDNPPDAPGYFTLKSA